MLTGIGFLSEGFEQEAADVLFIVGGLAAFFGLYAAMRSQFPPGAKVMTFPFKALWYVLRTLFAIPRWIWRQLWREPDGVTRGPFTRLMRRLKEWQTDVINDVVQPQFESVRKAAKEQHDEQNEKVDDQTRQMEDGFARVHERLDRGSQIMAEHATAIARFEEHIKNRPHNQRSTDKKDTPT